MVPERTVLLVDDDGDAVTSLARALKLSLPDFRFEGAGSTENALAVARTRRPVVAVIDLVLSPEKGIESGLSLLSDLLAYDPTCRAIVLTGHGGVDVGVRALERGAASFLAKPADIPHLVALIRDGSHQAEMRRAYQAQIQSASRPLHEILVGESAIMSAVREQLVHAARTPQPVLLYGETGTGKGLAARCLHLAGPRAEKRLVRYQPNFSTADLINSDLFGHLKGAFTGANDNRKGLLAEADGGTFFLDEVDELPLETQVSLLGVLQERKFRPIGANQEVPCSVKLVCATNRPPEESLKTGKLRKDFYHRIAHLVVTLPPLRDRKEDIPQLAAHVLAEVRNREQLHVFDCNASVLNLLVSYNWPGNVREFEAVLSDAAFRAHFAGRAVIEQSDVRPLGGDGGVQSPESFSELVETFKLKLIHDALARNGGNQVQAARELGLDRSTMRRFLSRVEKS